GEVREIDRCGHVQAETIRVGGDVALDRVRRCGRREPDEDRQGGPEGAETRHHVPPWTKRGVGRRSAAISVSGRYPASVNLSTGGGPARRVGGPRLVLFLLLGGLDVFGWLAGQSVSAFDRRADRRAGVRGGRPGLLLDLLGIAGEVGVLDLAAKPLRVVA